MTEINSFTKNLLHWFQKSGRHDLPWQQNPTPYRVWISEIMLQQTQVITVIKYYQRFIDKFSSIRLLSEANLDEVLSLWSGLGYYARARNIHRCAQTIMELYQGAFPTRLDLLSTLPGIGRSTAGAILSFSMNIRAPILDGNVKRVLTRFYAIEGSPTQSDISEQLWELTDQLTPKNHFSEYNQAIMDLGATICTRSKPHCLACPVRTGCQAYAQKRQQDFPYKKKKPPKPQKIIKMLLIKNSSQQIFLQKRPSIGIWGGLWSFPECDPNEDVRQWCYQHFNCEIVEQNSLKSFTHAFTHFNLIIHPVEILIGTVAPMIMEDCQAIWYHLDSALPGGIPSPIAKLFKLLKVSI